MSHTYIAAYKISASGYFVSKSHHGTGLGLFISKGIVEAHLGKIWGENNVDVIGATFSFTLSTM